MHTIGQSLHKPDSGPELEVMEALIESRELESEGQTLVSVNHLAVGSMKISVSYKNYKCCTIQ